MLFSYKKIHAYTKAVSPPKKEGSQDKAHTFLLASRPLTEKRKYSCPHFMGISCTACTDWSETRLLHSKNPPLPHPFAPHLCETTDVWHLSWRSQGYVIPHTFTTTLHSLLSHTIILQCSNVSPLPFKVSFTQSVHPFHGLSHKFTPLTLNLTIFTSLSSSTL